MTERKARPIIFHGDMVRALLDCRKTQTRRVIKPQQEHQSGASWVRNGDWHAQCQDLLCRGAKDAVADPIRCPYGQPGNLLWVRETWAPFDDHVAYRANGYPEFNDGRGLLAIGRWRPSIHMPRWASRLTLRITDVRVERVQEISAADAEAEGADCRSDLAWDGRTEHESLWIPKGFLAGFRVLWDSINAKRGLGWGVDPIVIVREFEVIRANVDDVLREAA